MATSTDPRSYPIGTFKAPESISAKQLQEWTDVIRSLPELLRKEVAKLSEQELDTPYRPEGWTGRQVVHHMADSHMNAFVRFKLSLTEEYPTIKPYFQELWANTPEVLKLPAESSLLLLEGLHARWAVLTESMTEEEFKRGYHHPETGKNVPLSHALGMYAWHSLHHLEHIKLIVRHYGK